MKERWRDVIDFEGLYQGSNLGQVKSLDRIVQCKGQTTRKYKGRILRPTPVKSYLRVVLCKGGIRTRMSVHQLVAAAWMGPCPNGMEVCHGPNGQSDNSVSNLRYDTHANNQLDRRRDGTHGGRCVRRSDGVEFISLAAAAEETGCDHSHISKVCRGKCKTVGGYGWEYIDN